MSIPYYVSPEQQMQDRAEFALKGISRGRSAAVISGAEGILFVAENHSATLNKLSEIYDAIGFAAVGRYNEFEQLRVMGIQQADLRGYSYDRRDVRARSLAGNYSQILGHSFAAVGEKPYEVELVLAEVAETPERDLIFHIGYDGTISERAGVAVLGGEPAPIEVRLRDQHSLETPLSELLQLARSALSAGQELTAEQLEVAVLDRNTPARRRFRRLTTEVVDQWLKL